MKKAKLTLVGITAAFLLSGCQDNAAQGQNDELQQQISALQQQVNELQQELSAETEAKKELESTLASSALLSAENTQTSENQNVSQDSSQSQGNQDAQSTQSQESQGTQSAQSQPAAATSSGHHADDYHTTAVQPNTDTSGQTGTTAQNQQPQTDNTNTQSNTTQTGTAQTKLDDLSATVDGFSSEVANLLASSVNKSIEQFFTYKQTAEQIDNSLDQYENWLENQYSQSVMTRDEYKSYERALDKLEDKLDDAEDNLEYAFGIDD